MIASISRILGLAGVLAVVFGFSIPISGLAHAQGASKNGAAGAAPAGSLRKATFGSGCFWCTEADFDKVPGVTETISGYMGGKTPNPTYQAVSTGTTGHAEVVQVTYDPSKVTYADLLKVFWRNVDPHTANGQFCDMGSQYRPVIFVHDSGQRQAAEASKTALEKSGTLKQPIVVAIQDLAEFTPAEPYHQNFYKTNPGHYTLYRQGCGRDRRLRQIWGATATN